jgi:hypothetical protein
MKGPRCCFLHLSHRERSDRIVRCDPGEGLRPIDGPYPLSPWERGRTDLLATIFTFNNHASLGGSSG